MIVSYLDYESEISALSQANRGLHHAANPLLYQHNVRHGHNLALAWGIIHASVTMVQMSLKEGAPLDICDEFLEWKPTALAAIHGQEAILRLLVCDHGVDPSPKTGWGSPASEYYEPDEPGNPLFFFFFWQHSTAMRPFSASSWTCRMERASIL